MNFREPTIKYNLIKLQQEISKNVVCATSKGSDQPAHMGSLIRAFASLLNILSVKLLTKYHFEFLTLKGGCKVSSESSSHLSKCHIAGNYMTWVFYVI